MASVCTAMPQHLRSLLFPLLMGCFEDQWLFKVQAPNMDENDSAAPPFDCLHFSWYNKYTTKVCYTSVGAHTTYSHSGLQGTFAPLQQCKNEHIANVTICIEGHGQVWTII